MDWFNKCRFCDVKSGEPHGANCPTLDKNPEKATKEWQEGYDRGFSDNYLPSYHYRYFSGYYVIGYEKGKNEIDRQIEDAEQARLDFPHQEY